MIGITVATSAMNGTFASPEAPRAISVNNGPSLRAKRAIAAQSVVSP